ncbi:hypothetical protein D3C87_1885170 [compost metagenome]
MLDIEHAAERHETIDAQEQNTEDESELDRSDASLQTEGHLLRFLQDGFHSGLPSSNMLALPAI